MRQQRRTFLKTIAGAIAGSLAARPFTAFAGSLPRQKSPMKLTFYPYTLELRHTFTIAGSSRTTTPVMLTEISFDGLTGYGEASMPPYLGETQESAAAFLSRVDLSGFADPFELQTILAAVDAIAPGNLAAKASVDIALHDLVGKLIGQPWYHIWGLPKDKAPYTSFTIGIDKPEVVREKVREAGPYKILKVKLGRDTDKEMIQSIRAVTGKPLTADANQGWTDKHQALDVISWCAEQGVVMIEQPMAKDKLDDIAWITERSPIPVIADESVQRLSDIPRIKGAFSGINVKLMKSTGMREAKQMIELARGLGMKVMLGCMTETSCAISAASQLSPLVDWADLDGALLINNDKFDGTKIIDGKVTPTDKPGIGATKLF